MFDENPSEQPELEAPDSTVQMERVEEDGDSFWCCPECKTDDYLMDIESQEMLDETIQNFCKQS